MSRVGQRERETQRRVVALFGDQLGYRYFGDKSDDLDNRNIEEFAAPLAHETWGGPSRTRDTL